MSEVARPPAVAGQFYAADAESLAHQLESCFTSRRGPAALPTRHRAPTRHIRAAIVPHAGLEYSGPIAALAFAAIAGERVPEHVLILGVDHHGAARGAATSDRDWAMPFGPVAVDHDLVRLIDHRPIEVDEGAHRREHSIEVELPFLQYVVPRPSFAPVMVRMGPYDFLDDVAEVIRKAVHGRDVLLIASTDFSHYVPATEAEQKDRLAIDSILRRRARELYDTVVENEISMCGIAPTTVLLAVLADETLGARLLRWGHSGESEPMREVVGYASLLLESESPL